MQKLLKLRVHLLLFLGLCLTYAAFSPGAIRGMGYMDEQMKAGDSILRILHALLSGIRPLPPMVWSRHGPLPVIFDLPFLWLGQHLFSEDFVLAFQPILFTALSVTVLFAWLTRLTSASRALFLALAGAFGTMLWPYAYIGLETTQSLFLLLAGYVVLAARGRSWTSAIASGLCCGLAVSLKSIGLMLLPAVLWLIYVQYRDDWRRRIPQILLTLAILASLWLSSAVLREQYFKPQGGSAAAFRPFLIDSIFTYFSNAVGLLGSPNKGLFLYAPLLLGAIYALPKTWRTHRNLTVFVLLTAAGLIAGLSILRVPSDEVWGPRYLHCLILPLLLCIGAGSPRLSLRGGAALVALTLVGVAISFLGAFYYYGLDQMAAQQASQNTMQTLLGNSDWNHPRFNARLLALWMDGKSTPALWTPEATWVWTRPPDAPAEKAVDLRPLCVPQPVLCHFWKDRGDPKAVWIVRVFLGCLLAGPVLLAVAAIMVRSSGAVAPDLS